MEGVYKFYLQVHIANLEHHPQPSLFNCFLATVLMPGFSENASCAKTQAAPITFHSLQWEQVLKSYLMVLSQTWLGRRVAHSR